MDIFAHGLWTNALFEYASQARHKVRSKKEMFLAIFFGIAPDLFSFGIYTVVNIFSTGSFFPDFTQARAAELYGGSIERLFHNPSTPDPSLLPAWLHAAYDLTHSLVIFAVAFAAVWLLRGKPYWLMAGWALHIGIDTFSHTSRFFPTPVLYPVSDFHLSGISWAAPGFMALNYVALVLVYWYLYRRPGRRAQKVRTNNEQN